MLRVYPTTIAGDKKPILARALAVLSQSSALVLSDVEKADVILVVDDAYLSFADALQLRRQFKPPIVAHIESDWPLPVFPGTYPSMRPVSLMAGATGWSYLSACDAEAWPDTEHSKSRYLFSFLGRVATHPIRRDIAALHTDETPCVDVADAPSFFPNFDRRDTYRQSLLNSDFVLCPRGFGRSSIRIFEAMACGRAPVVIGHDWAPPPVGNWQDFSVRIHEADIARIPNILGARRSEARQLGATAKRVFDSYFRSKVFFDRLPLALASEFSGGGPLTRRLISCDWRRHVYTSMRNMLR
ncbi:exostosin domain-containing protein [Alsobacter sp. R-9]